MHFPCVIVWTAPGIGLGIVHTHSGGLPRCVLGFVWIRVLVFIADVTEVVFYPILADALAMAT
jgi:hypothetical protein